MSVKVICLIVDSLEVAIIYTKLIGGYTCPLIVIPDIIEKLTGFRHSPSNGNSMYCGLK